MPIVQISQIRHRRGPRNNLPPSLAEGEIGFALDTGEVFIGGPNVPSIKKRGDKGDFPYYNVAILTETTDNVANYLFYRYRDRLIQYNTASAMFRPTTTIANAVLEYFEPITSTNVSIVVTRKLQEKLDEYVSVKDYGALGEGTFEILTSTKSVDNGYLNLETAAIRRAAIDLSNTVINETLEYGYHPKKLHFPAGIYMINDSLLIPPYAHFVGDGPTNTIIAMVSAQNGNDKEFRCLAFTVDDTLSFNQTDKKTEILNHSYANMTFSSTSQYNRSIVIENMTFIVAINPLTKSFPIDVFRFIGAKNVILRNCRIIGNWGFPFIGGALPGFEFKNIINGDFYYQDSVCLIFDSYDKFSHQYKPENIIVENCWIGNAAYGFIGTDDMKNILFENCFFNRLWRGISINEPLLISSGNLSYVLTEGNHGPKNVIVKNCSFHNIKREAIANFSTTSPAKNVFDNYHLAGIRSFGNYFENVGNNDTNNGIIDETTYSIATPVSPVINFGTSEYNVSVGDCFSRNFDEERMSISYGNLQYSRIVSKGAYNYISNHHEHRFPKRTLILYGNTSSFSNTGIKFHLVESPRSNMQFSMTINDSGNIRRREGRADLIFTPGNVSFTQNYNESNGPIDIELSAFVSGNEVNIKYVNNHTNDANMNYTIFYDVL